MVPSCRDLPGPGQRVVRQPTPVSTGRSLALSVPAHLPPAAAWPSVVIVVVVIMMVMIVIVVTVRMCMATFFAIFFFGVFLHF